MKKEKLQGIIEEVISTHTHPDFIPSGTLNMMQAIYNNVDELETTDIEKLSIELSAQNPSKPFRKNIEMLMENILGRKKIDSKEGSVLEPLFIGEKRKVFSFKGNVLRLKGTNVFIEDWQGNKLLECSLKKFLGGVL